MNNYFAVYRSSIDRACQCRFPVESLAFPEKLFSPWWSYRIQWFNSTTLKKARMFTGTDRPID